MEQSPPSPQPEPDEFGLHHCPHCTDAVVDLGEHFTTCTAIKADRLAEARRLLAEDERQRMQACHDELTAVLDKYGMNLTVTPARAVLVPKER